MAKYKLVVKYKNECELSLESTSKKVISKEFHKYMFSILAKENNFKSNFSSACKIKITEPVEKSEQTKQQAPVPEVEANPFELSFLDYVKNKNINTPLDEFVAGACYLDEIHDIKDFTLKQLNARLYPVFKRLADLSVIEHAKNRVLIETKEIDGTTCYSINQNAWNYHNYDLVRR